MKRVGKTNATQTGDAGYFTDWPPGPYGEWSGDCAKFAWVAYKRAGKTLVRNNAWPLFWTYYSSSYSERGRTKLPRYGSLVGWQWSPGHIAVAVGGSYVATTQSTDGANLPIARKSLSNTAFGGPNYYGWVIPRY
jgi:hypothetical protein